MSDGTHIEWTDATWNPITGCSVVSAGCKHCYAMKIAGGRLRDHESRKGLTVDTKVGPVWNGKVRFNEKWLTQPLQWARPRRIFVCAHGDLFHELVPDEWIDRVFAVMMLAQQHTFQVLTKRPARALEYLTTKWQPAPAQTVEIPGCETIHIAAESVGDTRHDIVVDECYEIASAAKLDERPGFWRPDDTAEHAHTSWPLPNVWIGTSVEDQGTANERIPLLLQCPAAVRWISAEPLLGPVTIFDLDGSVDVPEGVLAPLHWVVAGGESGHGARPMHVDWARSLRDQCAAAGVPFLFKQWGGHLPAGQLALGPLTLSEQRAGQLVLRDDRDELGWQHYPMSKKKAGRMLDRRLHDEYPK